MPVPKRRHSKGKVRRKRNQKIRQTAVSTVKCPNCSEQKQPHRVCPKCNQ